jgi:hypothetical protein
MNPKLLNSIRNILGIASVRKQLCEYLEKKEMNERSVVYPPSIQDIQENIPDISNRVEIVPFMEELDPTSGFVKVGWNLFVFGTNRKFLGYTIHESIDELKMAVPNKKAAEHSLCYTTGGELIEFIIDTLRKYNEDQIVLGPMKFKQPQVYAAKMPVSNAYYERNKMVGRAI